MPVTKGDIPGLFTAAARREFIKVLDAKSGEATYKLVSTTIPSTTDEEAYNWLGDIPCMREFTSERHLKDLQGYEYNLRNKKWEVSIAVDVDTLQDQKWDMIMPRVRSMADECNRHKNQLVMETIGYGFTKLCFDGKAFFATDHTFGNGDTAQSNKNTLALNHANIRTCITLMKKFKNDQGKTLGVNPTHLLVPLSLEDYANELVNNDFIPDTETNKISERRNTLKGKLKVIASDEFADACGSSGEASWCLLDLSHEMKPIIFQNRLNPEFSSLEKGSTMGFMHDEYAYGIKARYAAGYGPWFYAYGNLVNG